MEKQISSIYSKICMIDFDIFFDNPDWYSIISDKLNRVSVTQPFTKAYYLNLDYSISTTRTNCIDKKTTDMIDYNIEHTGFIWGFDRTWFKNYKLNDKTITGLGDTILSNNITKRNDNDFGSRFYYQFSSEQKYLDKTEYESCELNVYHLNHSPIVNRQYLSIHQILYNAFTKLNITNVDEILIRRDDNILVWNSTYLQIFNNIMFDYFTKRNDDAI
jgi:hypothetical protein